MAKAVLVTGTAGFIGFHTANALLKLGLRVVGLDNFNDYYTVRLKHARNAELEKNPLFRGIRMDVCDAERLLALAQGEQFDTVCHLAAQAGVRYSIDHPFAYQQANLEGFLSILEMCRHSGVKRLVYASSSSVYGGNRELPFSETQSVDAPISLYAATKKANELMAHTYTHLFGIQTIGLRFFTVYGPWGRPDMAVWLFTEAMCRKRPIRVFNHGEMRRDFTYIDDAVSGVLAAMFRETLDPYEIINLGNHCPERLLDMIEVLSDALGIKPTLDFQPMQPGDVEATHADITRAAKKLGYCPTTPISLGIPRFVEWYRDYTSRS